MYQINVSYCEEDNYSPLGIKCKGTFTLVKEYLPLCLKGSGWS